MARILVAALFLVLALTNLALAQATDDDRARAHFASGTAYYDQARYRDAAREFEEAFALSARPELLENAARSYERALLFDEAIGAIQRLRALQPESDATLAQRITSLEELRDRVHGDHDAPAPVEDAIAPVPEEPVVPESPPPSSSYVSVPGLVTLIAGGVLGLAAIGTGVGSAVLYDSVRGSCTNGACPESRRADADTGSALALTSTVLTFVAPVAIGVGILLLLLDTGPSRPSAEHAHLEWTSGPGELGLGARVRF